MKIFSRINEKLDSFYDKIDNRLELRKWNRLIDKTCKKHYIKNQVFKRMYKGIQKDVLALVNKNIEEHHSGIPHHLDYLSYHNFLTIIGQRIYDLNREFIFLINGDFHNSLYALTRQINEIYFILIKCRSDLSIIDKILKNKKLDLKIGGLFNEFKGKIKFPYVEFDENKFLDYIYDSFQEFSDLIHISGFSLSQNIWVTNKDNPYTRLFVEQPDIKTGDSLLIFSKKSVVPTERYQDILHKFYTFSGLCVSELKLLEEKITSSISQ